MVALDIQSEAKKLGVQPELITDNGRTDDRRLRLWRVGPVEVIETNGNSVWEDMPGFAALVTQLEQQR